MYTNCLLTTEEGIRGVLKGMATFTPLGVGGGGVSAVHIFKSLNELGNVILVRLTTIW